MVPTAVEQLEHLPAQILADFGLQGLLPRPHACWDGTGLHQGRGWGCHCCSHLCCATSAPRTTRGTEGAACDYPESGQMERGFLIPLHPGSTGLQSAGPWQQGTAPALPGWCPRGSGLDQATLSSAELWKMSLGVGWMEARLTPGHLVSSGALNGCQWV